MAARRQSGNLSARLRKLVAPTWRLFLQMRWYTILAAFFDTTYGLYCNFRIGTMTARLVATAISSRTYLEVCPAFPLVLQDGALPCDCVANLPFEPSCLHAMSTPMPLKPRGQSAAGRPVDSVPSLIVHVAGLYTGVHSRANALSLCFVRRSAIQRSWASGSPTPYLHRASECSMSFSFDGRIASRTAVPSLLKQLFNINEKMAACEFSNPLFSRPLLFSPHS